MLEQLVDKDKKEVNFIKNSIKKLHLKHLCDKGQTATICVQAESPKMTNFFTNIITQYV